MLTPRRGLSLVAAAAVLLLAMAAPSHAASRQKRGRRANKPYKRNGEVAFTTVPAGQQSTDILAVDPRVPGSQARTLITGGFNAHPAYSQDGSKIAFSSQRGASPTFEIYVADAMTGANPQPVTQAVAAGDYSAVPDFSCDDSKVAFEGKRAGDALQQMYVTNADGSGGLARIYPDPSAEQIGPKFSRDCKHLAFASTAGGAKDLYVLDIKVANNNAYSFHNPRRLTNGLVNAFSRAWSPDSKHIVFKVQDTGVGQLFVVAVRTGKLRHLTNNPGAFPAFTFGPGSFRGDITPRWSPDGKSVAFARQMAMGPSDSQGVYQIFVISAKGGEPRPLTSLLTNSISVGWQPVARKQPK